MQTIKIDKRVKYNDVFTLWSAINKNYNIDFKILDTVINTATKNKYLVLEFSKGYQSINIETLEDICNLLQNSYPKSEYKIKVRQYKYAPEQKQNILLALCK